MIIIVYSDAKIVNFRQTSSVNHIKKRDDAVFYLISVPKCHLRLSFLFLFRLTCIIRSFGLTKTKKLHAGMPVPFRFNSLQSLARSSGIGLQNCKALREVRESVCKIAKASPKFGNRFAKIARLPRSSGIVLHLFYAFRSMMRRSARSKKTIFELTFWLMSRSANASSFMMPTTFLWLTKGWNREENFASSPDW